MRLDRAFEDWNFDAQPGDRPDVTGPSVYTSGSKDQQMARLFDPEVSSMKKELSP